MPQTTIETLMDHNKRKNAKFSRASILRATTQMLDAIQASPEDLLHQGMHIFLNLYS